MTGLDPVKDRIIEIATLITDDDLKVVAAGPELVIHQSHEVMNNMIDIVEKMHESSGLTQRVQESKISLEEAGKQTLDFLKTHISEPGKVPLCGNSIGTDRRFLARQLPEIEDFLNYRSVDVTSIRELVLRWRPEIADGAPKKAGTHRALEDIQESIKELRWYRESGFIG